MNNYALNADVGQYLNVTLDTAGQNMVDSLLTNYSAVIDNYCNRTWRNTNPITEKFDANTDTFFPLQPKVTAVNSIIVAGVAVDPAYIYNYGTFIKVFLLPQVFSLPLLTYRQAVVIEYVTDAIITNTPADIKQALIRWVAESFQRAPDGGREIAEIQTGSVKVQYGTSRQAPDPATPPFVKMILDSYRLTALDHF